MDRLDIWFRLTLTAAAGLWGGLIPLVQVLVLLMVLDCLSGLAASVIQHRPLTSGRMWEGLLRKVIVLIVVAASAILEPQVNLPLDETVAGFYIAHELLSLMENAIEAGLPVPDVLKAVLGKLTTQPPVPPEPHHG